MTAVDLWVSPDTVRRTFDEAGVSDQVCAVQADVRTLPFEDQEFDAIVSVDAFEYFGTDVHLLARLLRVLRRGGCIAMSTPAMSSDPYVAGIPDHVRSVVGAEAAAWHSPDWWRRHWELTRLVSDVQARMQKGGADDWLRWARAVSGPAAPEVRMLEAAGDEIGFALVSARKIGAAGPE